VLGRNRPGLLSRGRAATSTIDVSTSVSVT
jgi:hypothetical protein